MTSRRRFLASAAAAPAVWAAKTTPSGFRYAEIEARIAKRDFHGITKDDLGTPAMIIDKTLFDKNLKTMADHCKATGIGLRAHLKVHKSTDVAKRQIAAGGNGICCATIAEAELLVNAGIRNVLYSCQPAGKNKIWRTVDLCAKDSTLLAVADDPMTVDLLDEAAGVRKVKLTVLPDVYAGLTRHGIEPGQKAFELAQRIDKKPNLKLGGLMAYSGVASHTKGWEARRAQSVKDVVPMIQTAELCRKAGLNVPVLTGGSTGTYNIDKALGLTELQAGSFIFMDTAYSHVGSKTGTERYAEWEIALTILTTVISRNHPNQVTIDAGNKAMLKPTDKVKGRDDLMIENQGAEYGIVKWNNGDPLKLGQKLELYTTNLDMTTNCYDRYYVCDGDNLVDVWPVMGRAGAVQR